MSQHHRPPRWAESVLAAVLPEGEIGDGILGDLREDFDRLAADRGWPPAAAWYLAQAVRIGVRYEVTRRTRSRRGVRQRIDVKRISNGRGTMMTDVMRDARFALRSLWHSPGFTLSAVLILAIGTAGATALFSLVDAVLLSPLSYPEPEQLVQVRERSPQGEEVPVSAGSALAWHDAAESFQEVGMYRAGQTSSMIIDGAPVLVTRAALHPSAFTVLGVRPLLGRGLLDEDATSGERIAVLSHATWRTYFGEDAGALGGTVVLDDLPHTVVGVMPPDFDFPATGSDLWTVLPEGSLGMTRGDFDDHTLSVVGRVRPGVGIQTAEAELTTFARRRAQDDPEAEGWGAAVVSLQDEATAESALLLTALLGGALIVLVVGCANLANLLLARGVRRAPEIAIRGAMGAGRGRILTQLAAENLLLGMLGSGAGVLGSILLLEAFVAIAPGDIPLLDRAAIDWSALRFALALSIACTVLFGLAPALRQTRIDPQVVLRGARGALGPVHGRTRGLLLASQVALAVTLVVGAGLFVRTVRSLTTADLGFDRTGLATMSVVLPGTRYRTNEAQSQLMERLVDEVRSVPGVLSVTEAMRPPGSNSLMSTPFIVEGREGPRPDGAFESEDLRWVWADYFETLDQEIGRGRGITAEDRADSRPVVVVNEAFAAKVWPNQDPIGRRIDHFQRRGEWAEVVGVVADARLDGLGVSPVPRYYLPYAQHAQIWQAWGTVVARVAPGGDMAAVQAGMRDALAAVDPALTPRSLGTVEDAYRAGLSRRTFAMALALCFAASVLLLCGFGLHGLVSFSVASRKREIGLRLALGGGELDILGAVVRSAMVLVAGGAAAGVVVSLLATRSIESLLYGIERTDATTYVATAIVVIAMAVVGASVPAWRAVRLDPVEALSSD